MAPSKLILPPSHPFLSISLAIYDSFGIRVVSSWDFNNKIDEKTIEDMFKIPLLNMRCQNNNTFRDYPTSIITSPINNIKMIVSSFNVTTKKGECLYSFGFFFKNDAVFDSPQINEMISNRVKEISYHFKYHISNGNEKYLSELEQRITVSAIEITELLMGGIKKLKPIYSLLNGDGMTPENNAQKGKEIFIDDLEFYTYVLNSHLETQMTTIIEVKDAGGKEYLNLFNFLAHFLLPYQRQLSSDKVHDMIIPGFFLQVVGPQTNKVFPYEKLLRFNRPWTYIVLSEKKIIKSQNIDSHLSSFHEYRNNIMLNPKITQKESESSIIKLQRTYRKETPLKTKLFSNFISDLQKLPIRMRSIACQQKLGEMINKAIALMEAVTQLISETGASFVSPKPAKDICSKIGISLEETKIIVSIAQLFDSKMYRRMYSEREEVLMQMVVTI